MRKAASTVILTVRGTAVASISRLAVDEAKPLPIVMWAASGSSDTFHNRMLFLLVNFPLVVHHKIFFRSYRTYLFSREPTEAPIT
jgi:hypothetical protein